MRNVLFGMILLLGVLWAMPAQAQQWSILEQQGAVIVNRNPSVPETKAGVPLGTEIATGKGAWVRLFAPERGLVLLEENSRLRLSPIPKLMIGSVVVETPPGKSIAWSTACRRQRDVTCHGTCRFKIEDQQGSVCLMQGSRLTDCEGKEIISHSRHDDSKSPESEWDCFSAEGKKLPVPEGIRTAGMQTKGDSPIDFEAPVSVTEADVGIGGGNEGGQQRDERASAGESVCLESGSSGSAGEVNGQSQGVEVEHGKATITVRLQVKE